MSLRPYIAESRKRISDRPSGTRAFQACLEESSGGGAAVPRKARGRRRRCTVLQATRSSRVPCSSSPCQSLRRELELHQIGCDPHDPKGESELTSLDARCERPAFEFEKQWTLLHVGAAIELPLALMRFDLVARFPSKSRTGAKQARKRPVPGRFDRPELLINISQHFGFVREVHSSSRRGCGSSSGDGALRVRQDWARQSVPSGRLASRALRRQFAV